MKDVFYVLKLDKKFAVVLLFVSLMVGGMMPLSKAHANLLTNPSFVGTFQNATSPATGYIAPGYWGDNSIGTVGVNYGAENAIKHDVFGYSQRIEVNSIGQGGAVQFYQNVPFTQGHYYQASVWLRSSITMTVNICFRLNGPPYTYFTDESTDNFHVTPVTVQPSGSNFGSHAIMVVMLLDVFKLALRALASSMLTRLIWKTQQEWRLIIGRSNFPALCGMFVTQEITHKLPLVDIKISGITLPIMYR